MLLGQQWRKYHLLGLSVILGKLSKTPSLPLLPIPVCDKSSLDINSSLALKYFYTESWKRNKNSDVPKLGIKLVSPGRICVKSAFSGPFLTPLRISISGADVGREEGCKRPSSLWCHLLSTYSQNIWKPQFLPCTDEETEAKGFQGMP